MSDTFRDRLRAAGASLTRAERQIADAIMENYPTSGMGSMSALASKARVSTPTVARLVQKLGYSGFPQLQQSLRDEAAARILNPITKQENWSNAVPDAHILNRFTDAVLENIRKTLGNISPQDFDAVARLMADERHKVYVIGGRITHTLAEYLFLHMQVIRRDVYLSSALSNAWPHALLDVAAGDVLIVFDIRRYERTAERMVEIAKAKGATIVLLTDQWYSPIVQMADYHFSCQIEVPSAWDSNIAVMLLVETLIAATQKNRWDETRTRMELLEEMFDATRIFRKFV